MARQRPGATGTEPAAQRPSRGTNIKNPREGRPARAGSKPAPGLYLIATPIGNMGDITYRAVEVLAAADLVACEDTRVTGGLMTKLGLDRPLTPYHEHNAERARPHLISQLKDGKVVALVSDAGTPLVSDPGYRLVRACVAEDIAVTALPGASAMITALQLSGLPNDRFLFGGFLPAKATARRQALRELAAVPATLMFYESPNRLGASLADMAAVLGAREAAVARELTKLHEEVARGDLFALANRYADAPPKGEVVVVVAPPDDARPATADELDDRLRKAVADGATVKDAAALVAAETGFPRRDVYARALRLFTMGEE
ncbi:16S rRNA (cytidine(1402)-2'-O)-methyltransferase [Magnetospirillum sp. LM-5]|uniref:16S rRNA (cytidine(1402)-2'-O)-methyltransferase n=1 Tax=Magnetospirillum sp. LM-5 TaxID=2681466 RepID=UPI00156F5BFF|nr:16S rRNA (cytidine(1402)-2'-O)-methyltransferase [Magnetospirillum sp. LM-5]